MKKYQNGQNQNKKMKGNNQNSPKIQKDKNIKKLENSEILNGEKFRKKQQKNLNTHNEKIQSNGTMQIDDSDEQFQSPKQQHKTGQKIPEKTKGKNQSNQDDNDGKQNQQSIYANANWDKMKSQISTHSNQKHKHKNFTLNSQNENGIQNEQKTTEQDLKSVQNLDSKKEDDVVLTRIIALDCEMVGVGFEGGQSVVARVSIVNDFGNVVYDKHVQPKMRVTDFRTKWSGIRPSDLKTAVTFEEMQEEVCKILKGRILVGHSLQNDLKVLQIGHPKRLIRDTARYPPLLYSKGSRLRPKSLKQLAREQLQLNIQEGEHSSVEDARAALYIYHKFREIWEQQIRNHELQGYKYVSFPKRKNPVKDKNQNAKSQNGGNFNNSEKQQDDDNDDFMQSSFSFEKMQNMQTRMNDPYLDPMADL
eukprot:TRINITY_DN682_c0_g1_i7.p1 TRINITY_DN682_c0_g1~~TRINITY_DN682_c0_g1_i7.p1  ORF type:complete len:419 (-),score=66.63 TRINITY_DN682_c0_g1_i7:419-1675(-)